MLVVIVAHIHTITIGYDSARVFGEWGLTQLSYQTETRDVRQKTHKHTQYLILILIFERDHQPIQKYYHYVMILTL